VDEKKLGHKGKKEGELKMGKTMTGELVRRIVAHMKKTLPPFRKGGGPVSLNIRRKWRSGEKGEWVVESKGRERKKRGIPSNSCSSKQAVKGKKGHK